MGESIQRYRYELLNHSQMEVRLLKLYPGHFASQLVAKLETISLTQVLHSPASLAEWDALSYAWEQQTPSKPVLIDGKQLDVTNNVESALRHLRDRNTAMFIWIDSACINQDDEKEKKSPSATNAPNLSPSSSGSRLAGPVRCRFSQYIYCYQLATKFPHHCIAPSRSC